MNIKLWYDRKVRFDDLPDGEAEALRKLGVLLTLSRNVIAALDVEVDSDRLDMDDISDQAINAIGRLRAATRNTRKAVRFDETPAPG